MRSKVRRHVKSGSTILIPWGQMAPSFPQHLREHLMNLVQKRRLAFLLLGFFIGTMARAEEADLLLTNGNIYTGNARQPRAEAIAAKNGRVLFVGSNAQAKKIHAAKV